MKELPHVMRYATALTGNYHSAEELLAQSLVRALKIAEHRDKKLSLRYWLLAILSNIYNDPYNNFATKVQNNHASNIKIKAESKFDQLFLQELQTALHRLPPFQKQVFLLVTLEEIPYKDITSIIDLPLNKIMALLQQSRQSLRQLTTPTDSKIEVAS